MERVRKQIGLTETEDVMVSGMSDTKEYKDSDKKSIGIAVLDTGAAAHPDIRDNIVYFKDFTGDGRSLYDDNSHGTHICGILCGSGKLSGGKYRGIATDAKLVICKVLDKKGEGKASDMLKALQFVQRYKNQLDIRIVNISVGMGELKDIRIRKELDNMIETLWKEGLVVVCAAGNKGPADGSISSVGGNNKVITVGCHDGDYFKTDQERCELHSGRGQRFGVPRKPDIVAPGSHIVSCNNIWSSGKVSQKISYIEKSGTSMATPIISASVALLLKKEPWLSPDQVKEKLLYSATDLKEPWNKQGWGMVNVRKLLEI